MNRTIPPTNRFRNRRLSELARTEKKLPCPVCGELVKVGGPVNGNYIIQPHGKDMIAPCTGTNQTVQEGRSR